MWWDRILNWFSNQGERKQVIQEFNKSAKDAFIADVVPVYLKAETSRGNSAYKHQFSNFFLSGFRIRTLSGRNLLPEEISHLGMIIINDSFLTRRLVTLGYDTLEITDINGYVVKDWRLTALLELQ